MFSQRFLVLCCIIMLLSTSYMYSITLSPESAFIARVYHGENVVVGALPEDEPAIYSFLLANEGRTSDRTILEFDLREESVVDSAILTFTASRDLGNSDLDVYAFQANGLVNAADYYRTDEYVGTSTSTYYYLTPCNFDITTTFNDYILNSYSHLGLLIKNTWGSRHWIYDPVITITLSVTVDIKSASCPNPLNTKSKGILPVAILGTEDFDVSTIDIASIELNGIQPIRSNLEDVSTPLLDPNECECSTASPDGITDLTLKFDTQQIVESLGEVNTDDVIPLTLTGVLDDETPIEGQDCVVIVGRHKPINIADVNKDGVVNVFDMTIFAQNWLESSIVEE